MTIHQNNTYVPPALRAAKPKHAASRSHTAKRVAGGAIVSAALATGFAGLGSLSGLNTGTAQAACQPDDFLCLAGEGGAELFGGGDGSLFGAGVGATANAFGTFDALDPLNLVGPGGSLIGNGLDALEIDPNCTSNCARRRWRAVVRQRRRRRLWRPGRRCRPHRQRRYRRHRS